MEKIKKVGWCVEVNEVVGSKKEVKSEKGN